LRLFLPQLVEAPDIRACRSYNRNFLAENQSALT
jgi:hypothetical protein